MDENHIKLIQKTLSALPKRLQEVILSDSYEDTLAEIGKKYNLNLGQLGLLEKDTTLVLMGLTKQSNFESDLKKNLDIEIVKIHNIALEVKDKIFSKVNDILEMLSEQIQDEESSNFTPEQTKSDSSSIQQKLDARFDKLPENIRGLVEKSNYQTTLYDIARTHKLSVTQMGTLDTITTDLIVGAIHPDEFKKAVTKGLELSEEEATSLVNDINEKVFKSIRGQLMGINSLEPKKPEIQTPKSDLDTLKSHGIDIVPEKLEITTSKPEIHPLLTQKMSTSVQTQTVKNQYELKSTPAKAPEVKNPVVEAPKIKTYPKGADPYRVIPE